MEFRMMANSSDFISSEGLHAGRDYESGKCYRLPSNEQ
jgi:hypothetical protein